MAAAVSLTAKHSISQISKELVLDYSALKKRVPNKNKDSAAKMSPSGFIELNLEPLAAASECIVDKRHVMTPEDFPFAEATSRQTRLRSGEILCSLKVRRTSCRAGESWKGVRLKVGKI